MGPAPLLPLIRPAAGAKRAGKILNSPPLKAVHTHLPRQQQPIRTRAVTGFDHVRIGYGPLRRTRATAWRTVNVSASTSMPSLMSWTLDRPELPPPHNRSRLLQHHLEPVPLDLQFLDTRGQNTQPDSGLHQPHMLRPGRHVCPCDLAAGHRNGHQLCYLGHALSLLLLEWGGQMA